MSSHHHVISVTVKKLVHYLQVSIENWLVHNLLNCFQGDQCDASLLYHEGKKENKSFKLNGCAQASYGWLCFLNEFVTQT